MCSILCWILSIWEALGCIFPIFGLIHALPTRGGELELEMACWMHLEGFQVVSSHFWALGCTGLSGRGHRSDWSDGWSCSHVAHQSDRWCWPVWPVRARLLQLPCFNSCLACIGSGGACMCAVGALCGSSSFGLVVCTLCFNIVLSRMCRAVALA
jgi:hypothetical protein